jgi:tetratricopeptide (TPR) repeat protein
MSDSKDLLRMLNLCESEVEKLFLLSAYEHIEGLVPQYTVLRYRIDFAIPDKRIAIEIDGHEYHKTKEQRTHDTQREREIKLTLPADWTVIRFTGTEIFQNTTRCVDEVLQFIQKNLHDQLVTHEDEKGPLIGAIFVPNSPSSITSTNNLKIQCGTHNCNPDRWYIEGVALGKQGKHDDAIKAYDEAIRIDPKYVGAWYNKGCSLEKQGKYDEAIRCYDMTTAINPRFACAWMNKGCSLDEQGKYDDAIRCYDKAIKLKPNWANAWNNKGESLYKLLKYEEAIEAYDKAIKLDPNHANAWYYKGNALKSLGNNIAADAAYARARELGYNG